MLEGLRFQTRVTPAQDALHRADVACFVGRVALRALPVPSDVLAQWRANGLDELLPSAPTTQPRLPIAVESFAAFDAIFDGWVRTTEGLTWESALTSAVREFFRQGGRRCYVVSCGDPIAPPIDTAAAEAAIDAIVPGAIASGAAIAAHDRSSWRGLAHVLGLPEVAFVCLPDLPSSMGASVPPAAPLTPERVPPQQFVECSKQDFSPLAIRRDAPGAPRLDDAQWNRWQSTVSAAVAFIKRYRPDLQLVLALPLSLELSMAHADPLAALAPRLVAPSAGGVGSAFLQLAYPWVTTDSSADQLGALAPPDGLLAGVIARSTLAQGAFRSIVRAPLEGIRSLEPMLAPNAIHVPRRIEPALARELALIDRISLIGLTPDGVALLSDCTPSPDPLWRQAGSDRLMGVLRRALSRIGESAAFEISGPGTWRNLTRRIEGYLESLRMQGAFADIDEPYLVRCDATTMTQTDIDDGRVIARVEVAPAVAIERITIVLALDGSGAALVRDARDG